MQDLLQGLLADFGCQTGTIHLTGDDGELKLRAQVGVVTRQDLLAYLAGSV